MHLEHLKVFYITAKTKKFSETAKILYLSQPSVSMQIKQLEAKLNIELFDRTTKKVELTKAGNILYKYAEQILGLVHNAQTEMSMLSETDCLKIGASITIGEYVLPYHLVQFKRSNPKVDFRLNLYQSQQIVDGLNNGEINLGFVEAPVYHNKQLECVSFIKDELVLITSSNLKGYEDFNYTTCDDLYLLPLIFREKDSDTRIAIERALLKSNLNINKLNIIFELESTESIKTAVAAGMGASIISRTALQKEEQLGILKLHQMKDVELSREFFMLFRKNTLNLGVETFKDYLLNSVDIAHA